MPAYISSRKVPPFIKVCGQTHAPIVDCAAAFGAQFIGFVFHEGSPRSIAPERAADINSVNMCRVGVFVRQRAEEILSIMRLARLDYAQLHGEQTIEDAQIIGARRVIRVLWPEKCQDARVFQCLIDQWESYCSYYLLDAGKTCGCGGSGCTIQTDWINCLRFPHPWILAGGLNDQNIPSLLRQFSPDGLDLNSGIESAPGMKVPNLMLRAISAASYGR